MKNKILISLLILIGVGCREAVTEKIEVPQIVKSTPRQDSMLFMKRSWDSVAIIYDSVNALTYRYGDTCQYWIDRSREHLYTPEFHYYMAKAEKYKRKFDRMSPALRKLWHVRDSIKNSIN